jgi:hypothetical protein
MFCCEGFRNLVGEAGQRGISVLVRETSAGFRFRLLSRAVSKTDEVRFSETPLSLPIEGNITLAASIGLNFCPFCGANLQGLVTPSTLGRIRALAKDHKSIDGDL